MMSPPSDVKKKFVTGFSPPVYPPPSNGLRQEVAIERPGWGEGLNHHHASLPCTQYDSSFSANQFEGTGVDRVAMLHLDTLPGVPVGQLVFHPAQGQTGLHRLPSHSSQPVMGV